MSFSEFRERVFATKNELTGKFIPKIDKSEETFKYKLRKEHNEVLIKFLLSGIAFRMATWWYFQNSGVLICLSSIIFCSIQLFLQSSKYSCCDKIVAYIPSLLHLLLSTMFSDYVLVLGPLFIVGMPVLILLISRSYLACAFSYITHFLISMFVCQPQLNSMWEKQDIESIKVLIGCFFTQSLQLGFTVSIGVAILVHSMDCMIKQLCQQKKELQELNTKLTRVNEELRKVNMELESNLEGKNQFILGFSHELLNPLNIVLGNVDLACTEANPPIKKYLNNAKNSGQLLLLSINNILDYGKVDQKILEISETAVDSQPLFAKAWATLRHLIIMKGLCGEFYVSDSVPEKISIDTHRMMQIMFNLIGNAAKFTSKGHIKVVISWIKGKALQEKMFLPSSVDPSIDEFPEGSFVFQASTTTTDSNFTFKTKNIHLRSTSDTLPFKKPGIFMETEYEDFNDPSSPKTVFGLTNEEGRNGYMKLEVIDSGVGISNDTLSGIFQKFSQISSLDETQRRLGTSMGLWITYNLCRRMNGDIRVFSKLKQGSTFVAIVKCQSLPQRRNSAISTKVMTHNTSSIHSKGRVLPKVMVVDDNLANQFVLKSILHKLEVEVSDTAVNGLEAFEKYKKRGNYYFDYIFMDLEMPVMDGILSSTKIRDFEQRNTWKSTKIVIVTGNCDEKVMNLCLNMEGPVRANHYFRKPFSFNDCANLLENSRAEEDNLSYSSLDISI